ncbi:hypothetical protein Glove_71g62 [Diversispora epigaea]|uniref:TLDc domain-containing protein n=1 Tax=Diversispora epigaea TaxID=1348612 RepID=A0A397JC76_9GLOM|nr:hypothetical protein Glove_71g62 [Diversispora epigaea]
MSLQFFDKLSQNFIELLNDKEDYNELENIQPNKNNIKIINKPSVSPQIFNVILQYIYGGIVNLENTETRFVYDLIAHENFCNDIVVKYPNLIFDADNFASLEESALISLLERDDLQMEEVKIWDYVIKWVLVTELPLRTKESKETFSTIISEYHAAEISSWIDHGFAPQTFWNICHGHARTVVVAKIKGTDEIIGGYNPLAWDNTYDGKFNKWRKTNDSFIFSLKNGNIQNSIFSRVKNTQYAILDVYKNYQNVNGPYFGLGFCLRGVMCLILI